MKKICLVVLLLVGCSASYVIPDGKTTSDFNDTKHECEQICGTKQDNLLIGDSEIYGALVIGEIIQNSWVEYTFRDCMKARGYAVK